VIKHKTTCDKCGADLFVVATCDFCGIDKFDNIGDLTVPKCEICKDTGMTGWEKPMSGINGEIHMVFVPQTCLCEAGLKVMQVSLNLPGTVETQ
jgi:hypothetical protein